MKKFMLMLALIAGTVTYGTAQSKKGADTASRPKMSKVKMEKVGDAQTAKSSTGVNKDGSPDMRVKANKEAAAKQKAQTGQVPVAQSTTPSSVPVQSAKPAAAAKAGGAGSTSADKVVGKDAKGRTIYQGPKNGQYIMNANGNKEYIKKTN